MGNTRSACIVILGTIGLIPDRVNKGATGNAELTIYQASNLIFGKVLSLLKQVALKSP